MNDTITVIPFVIERSQKCFILRSEIPGYERLLPLVHDLHEE